MGRTSAAAVGSLVGLLLLIAPLPHAYAVGQADDVDGDGFGVEDGMMSKGPSRGQLGLLISRKVPITSTKQLPPAPVYRQLFPSPQDPTIYSVGNNVTYRPFLDYNEDLQLILPGATFADHGFVTSWSVFSGRDCRLTAQVLRRVETPMLLKFKQENKSLVLNSFILVGENTLLVTEMGKHDFHISEDEQIEVNPGDLIAFHSRDPGCVAYSDGGSIPVLYRYGHPERREHQAYDVMVAVGEGLSRTYSIAVKGKFEPHTMLSRKKHFLSPSPSPSPSMATPSPTASYTPFSLSPTLSPIISTTPSNTPSPSSSLPPSETPSPSYTPSPSAVWHAECSKGIAHVCMHATLIDNCGLKVGTCITALEALKMPLPGFLSDFRRTELGDVELESLSRMSVARLRERVRHYYTGNATKPESQLKELNVRQLYNLVRDAILAERRAKAGEVVGDQAEVGGGGRGR